MSETMERVKSIGELEQDVIAAIRRQRDCERMANLAHTEAIICQGRYETAIGDVHTAKMKLMEAVTLMAAN